MTISRPRVTWAAIVVGTSVATIASGPALSGCALFTDLDGSKYTVTDAGTDGGCGDGGCGLVLPCVSAANCSGQVCCATGSLFGPASVACQSADSCKVTDLGFQLCQTDTECTNGGPCAQQTCVLAGGKISVQACSMIPGCTAQ